MLRSRVEEDGTALLSARREGGVNGGRGERTVKEVNKIQTYMCIEWHISELTNE